MSCERIIKMKLKIMLVIVCLFSVLMVPSLTYAANNTSSKTTVDTQKTTETVDGDEGGDAAEEEPGATTTPSNSTETPNGSINKDALTPFREMVKSAIGILFAFAVSLALINVVYQGFRLMGANQNSQEAAKASAVKSFIGLAVIVFSYTVIQVMVNILGSSIK